VSLPISNSKEAIYLETGCSDIDFPAKGDWTRQVQEDLFDFDIEGNLTLLEEAPPGST
jgi:hypothetical protein